jgi:mannose-6-phosphate isomerase-like protein (cupin superfamily)
MRTLKDAVPTDLTRLGAGMMSHTGERVGGESRLVKPKDIIIVPAGTPHRFSQFDGPISYLVYRFWANTAAK